MSPVSRVMRFVCWTTAFVKLQYEVAEREFKKQNNLSVDGFETSAEGADKRDWRCRM